MQLREDDGGFSTLGMVIALGLSLVLVFSGFRVYRVQTVSAGVQDVADVAALAAENQVACFVSVARICDAAVLSFSLTGIVVALIGVAALCVPVTAPYAESLLTAAKNIFSARDKFAREAAEGLELYQRCLPYLACVRAASVAQANNGPDGASYLAIALLSPFEGDEIGTLGDDGGKAQQTVEQAQDSAEDVRKKSEEAERLSREADELKRQAWELDCGDATRSLMERAEHLGGLSGTSNPKYASADAWSFSVPIVRCRAYYQARLQAERAFSPANPEEAADSALRTRIYEYAVEEFARAYAVETDSGFTSYFPVLPRNMAELRATPLYTEPVYPMSTLADGTVMMHAYAGCPGAAGCTVRGSIAKLEASERTMCPYCEFVPTSLADVCAATSVVNTGFEFYYRKIAALAERYQGVRDEAGNAAAPAKRTVRQLLESLGDVLKQLGGERLHVRPPGSFGAVALVVDLGEVDTAGPFSAAFLGADAAVGARAAVSAATLVEDNGDGAQSVIRGLPAMLGLTGTSGDASYGVAGTVVNLALGLWSSLVEAYDSGQDALDAAADRAMDGFSWRSSSGLGAWAAKLVRGFIHDAGLEAAPTGYVKPVLVNTGLVAAAEENAWSSGYLTVKNAAGQVAAGAGTVSSVIQLFGMAGQQNADGEDLPEGGIVITLAQELLGGESPLTLAFTLLSEGSAAGDGTSAWAWAIGGVLGIVGEARGIRDWR